MPLIFSLDILLKIVSFLASKALFEILGSDFDRAKSKYVNEGLPKLVTFNGKSICKIF